VLFLHIFFQNQKQEIAMGQSAVDLDIVGGGSIAVVTLNRPDALNALNLQEAEELGNIVEALTGEMEVRAVVLTGEGRAFCAGGDLASFREAADPAGFLHDMAVGVHRTVRKIRSMASPWIAAINGPCFGVGLSLACLCDIRIAAENARFRVAFTGVGLAPDTGLLYFLPKIVGLTRAAELALTNPVLSSDEALRIGLVTRVVKPENLMDAALETARGLTRLPPMVLGMERKMLDASYCETLDQHLDRELACVRETGGSADFREGCQAFFEKRSPQFQGK
jgi:2-(1,2-epoxy-1,2-dihydrophenyl)acetyl-CoA isomerase